MTDDELRRLHMQNDAGFDQAWAYLRDHHADVTRVFFSAVRDGDELLTKMAMVVFHEISKRIASTEAVRDGE